MFSYVQCGCKWHGSQERALHHPEPVIGKCWELGSGPGPSLQPPMALAYVQGLHHIWHSAGISAQDQTALLSCSMPDLDRKLLDFCPKMGGYSKGPVRQAGCKSGSLLPGLSQGPCKRPWFTSLLTQRGDNPGQVLHIYGRPTGLQKETKQRT